MESRGKELKKYYSFEKSTHYFYRDKLHIHLISNHISKLFMRPEQSLCICVIWMINLALQFLKLDIEQSILVSL